MQINSLGLPASDWRKPLGGPIGESRWEYPLPRKRKASQINSLGIPASDWRKPLGVPFASKEEGLANKFARFYRRPIGKSRREYPLPRKRKASQLNCLLGFTGVRLAKAVGSFPLPRKRKASQLNCLLGSFRRTTGESFQVLYNYLTKVDFWILFS